MRISISTPFLIAFTCLVSGTASAASSTYICAISEAYECVTVEGCKRVSLNAINLSEFIMLDLDKKQLTAATMDEEARTEDIEGMTSTDKAIFLHGTQDEESWNATISLKTGELTGGIASGSSSFAIFGNCTDEK